MVVYFAARRACCGRSRDRYLDAIRLLLWLGQLLVGTSLVYQSCRFFLDPCNGREAGFLLPRPHRSHLDCYHMHIHGEGNAAP